MSSELPKNVKHVYLYQLRSNYTSRCLNNNLFSLLPFEQSYIDAAHIFDALVNRNHRINISVICWNQRPLLLSTINFNLNMDI